MKKKSSYVRPALETEAYQTAHLFAVSMTPGDTTNIGVSTGETKDPGGALTRQLMWEE